MRTTHTKDSCRQAACIRRKPHQIAVSFLMILAMMMQMLGGGFAVTSAFAKDSGTKGENSVLEAAKDSLFRDTPSAPFPFLTRVVFSKSTDKPADNAADESFDVASADDMYMHFWWEIPASADKDDLSPSIPYAFDIPTSVSLGLTTDKTITMKDQDGDIMANVVIPKNSNTGILHFTEKASEKSDVFGWFWFGGKFNKEEIGNPDEFDFPFVIQGNPANITVIFDQKSESDDSTIEKKGEVQPDGSIKWTIKFAPKMTPSYSKTEITSAVITDEIPSNQELVDPDGDLSKCMVLPVLDGAAGFSYSNPTLTYDFGSGDVRANESYTLTYLTKPTAASFETYTADTIPASGSGFDASAGDDIENGDLIAFKNKAEISYDFGGTAITPKETNAPPVNIEKKLLKKEGEQCGTDSYADTGKLFVKWTVTINESNLNIDGIEFKDTLPPNMTLVDGNEPDYSSWVTALGADCKPTLSPDENGVSNSFHYTPQSGSTDGTLEWSFGNITQKTVVTYYTYVTDPTKLGTGASTFTNAVEVTKDGGGIVGTAEKGVGVDDEVLTKGTVGSYNAATHRLQWKITVNKNKQQNLTDLTLTDTPNGEQEYVSGSMKMEWSDGSKADITDAEITGGKADFLKSGGTVPTSDGGFILKLEDVAKTETLTIIYETEVTDKNIFGGNVSNKEFTNTAKLEGTFDGTANSSSTKTAKQNATSSVLVKSLPESRYDYQNQQAKWKIDINKNKMPVNNAEFVDYFEVTDKAGTNPVTGLHVYDTNSLSVKNADTQEELVGSNKIAVTFEPVSAPQKMTIHFAGEINEHYVVTYNTKLAKRENAGQDEILTENSQLKLTNHASFTGDTIADNITDTKYITVDSSVVEKTCNTSTTGKTGSVEWFVDINKNQVTLGGSGSDIVLKDILQKYLELNPASVSLCKLTYDVKTNKWNEGTVIPFDSKTLKVDTAKTAEEGQEVTITLKNTLLEEPCRLKFWTDIKAPDGQTKITVENTISLEGGYVKQSAGTTSRTLSIDASGGSSSGKLGSLTLTKKNAKDNKLLPGAKFEVRRYFSEDNYDVVGGGEQTTNDKGVAEFKNLLLHVEYTLVETKAPTGFEIAAGDSGKPGEWKFTLEGTTQKPKDLKREIKNSPATGGLRLKKTGEGGQPLAGAKFQLYHMAGSAPADTDKKEGSEVQTTGAGIAEWNDLPFDTYYVKETSAPEAYHVNTSMAYSMPAMKNGETVEMATAISNSKKQASFQLTKVDAADNSIKLANAQIQVFRKGEDGAYAAVTEPVWTGEAGLITLPLIYGDYYYVELQSPDGYYMDDADKDGKPDHHEFTIGMPTQNEQVVAVTLENSKIPIGNFEITKKDEDSKEPLAGAEFTLYENGNVINTAITDKDGKAIFENLRLDRTYTWEETAPPINYLLNEVSSGSVSLTEDKTAFLSVICTNKKATGKLTVNKINSAKEPLAGAEIALYRNVDATEQIGSTITTDSDGVAAFPDELVPGTYYYKELKAPAGYLLDNTVKSVEITYNTQSFAASSPTVDLYNYKHGKLVVWKTNTATTPASLSGAVIGLYAVAENGIDGTELERATSGADGKAVFTTDLKPGKYYYQEISAPTGYRLDSAKYPFEMTSDGKTDLQILEPQLKNSKKSSGGGGGGGGDDPTPPTTPPTTPPVTPEVPPVTPPTPITPVDPGTPSTPPVTPPNNDHKKETPKDTPVDGTVDIPDGGVPKVGRPPENGTVTVNPDGGWTYTPSGDYIGKDQFTIVIDLPDGTSIEELVEIDVEDVPLGGMFLPEDGSQLPKTSGVSGMVFYLTGSALLLAGVYLRRRMQDKLE